MQKFFLIILAFILSANITFAQDEIFNTPSNKLVVDNAKLFSQNEIAALTQKLNKFNQETSTQILVYTTPDLYGYDVADFAQRLGEGWKVGQQGFDNGIVLVFKPKTSTPGRISISVGYGIEEFIPDVTANQIIENEMIPLFKKGGIYQGINAGLDVCISLTKEEFTAQQYSEQHKQPMAGGIIFILIFFVFLFAKLGQSRNSRYYNTGRRSNLGLWATLFLLGSGSSRGSGWNDFSSGSGSFGGGSGFGGGGGFGGFGGGSFGGGGASGSW